MKLLHSIFLVLCSILFLLSCSVSRHISKQANTILLKDSAISQGHIGISIYEPATGKYWYNYNADKYFVPSSNTKLFTLYAGMKYLGDSLIGLRYKMINDTIIDIYPTGDPTFLHPDFAKQPVFDFLKKQHDIVINETTFPVSYGNGWAWDDHQDTYMVPRSQFPLFGNLVTFKWINKDSVQCSSKYLSKKTDIKSELIDGFKLEKKFGENQFTFLNGTNKLTDISFDPDMLTCINLLSDTLKNDRVYYFNTKLTVDRKKTKSFFSQPSDSLFKPMMHNSDNFFAEQTLLMASNEYLGYMSDEKMIDTLLKTALKNVPQKPKWVDGSGLSRYNLFTPLSFIYILNKMKDEFGIERLKNILPTGGEGTLKNYFKTDSLYIFAKTGTISNNCALSGFLFTQKGKLLIFSILANNYQTGSSPVRHAVENFLQQLRKKY